MSTTRTQQSQIDVRYHIVDTIDELRRIKTAFAGSTALCYESGILYEYRKFPTTHDLFPEQLPDIIIPIFYYEVNDEVEGNASTLRIRYTRIAGVEGDLLPVGIQLYYDKNCTQAAETSAGEFKYTGNNDPMIQSPGCWVAATLYAGNTILYTFTENTWAYDETTNSYRLRLPVNIPVYNITTTFYSTSTNEEVQVDSVKLIYTSGAITGAYAYVPYEPNCTFSGKVLIAFDRIVS